MSVAMKSKALPVTVIISMLLICLFVSGGVFAAQSVITPEKVTHSSTLLGVEKSFFVYPPRNFDPSKRYPVLYIIHPLGGDYTSFKQSTKLGSYLTNYDMFVVLPDATKATCLVDGVENQPKYESYISSELISFVDSHYSTVAEPGARGIAGFSMGGHGAMNVAVRKSDVFGSVTTFAGCLDLSKHTDNADMKNLLGAPTKAKELWSANNPLSLAIDRKISSKLKINVMVGILDPVLQENRDFHQALLLTGIPHSYTEDSGGHDWSFVNSHLEATLLFHDRVFKQTATWLR